MTDKYRDNKRDGVASDYTYTETPLENKTSIISIKSITTISLVSISVISIFVNILLFNQNEKFKEKNTILSSEIKKLNQEEELKGKKIISNFEIKKLNQNVIDNSKKIDDLTKKLDKYIFQIKK